MKKNRKGFTLAELLIVVAIIAVLVAISIPIFTSQLEKSRKAVDLANVRSAKAAAAAEYMNSGMTESKTYYYDAATGTVTDLETARSSIEGYGKSHHPFDSKKRRSLWNAKYRKSKWDSRCNDKYRRNTIGCLGT